MSSWHQMLSAAVGTLSVPLRCSAGMQCDMCRSKASLGEDDAPALKIYMVLKNWKILSQVHIVSVHLKMLKPPRRAKDLLYTVYKRGQYVLKAPQMMMLD